MERTLEIEIDRTTWPKPPSLPAFPRKFASVGSPSTISVLDVLLTIGFLTTPAEAVGISLSEYWAWVRYLHAISDAPDLRLTTEFANLDAHQKTILSDDFGMGVPIALLADKLDLVGVCDGRYFVDRLAAATGAIVTRSAKRGPNKTPDFVGLDLAGRWHVIECKGTQSGVDYRQRQLLSARPQKRSIIFPRAISGQSLASGLLIGIHPGHVTSHLRIVDPPQEEGFAVTENEAEYADDTVLRAVTAKGLRLSGFGNTSSMIGTPEGRYAWSRPTRGRSERRRKEFLDERQRSASEELHTRSARTPFTVAGEKFRGRQIRFDLPAPVQVKDRTVRRVRLQQGTNVHVLASLNVETLKGELLSASDASLREALTGIALEADNYSGQLRVGRLFVSRMQLLS